MTSRVVTALPPEHPRKAGRPRGSAAPPLVLGYPLTRVEATPFAAGLRIGKVYKGKAGEIPNTIEGISPHLMPHERQLLAERGDDHFMAWYCIGLAAHIVSLMIDTVRAR